MAKNTVQQPVQHEQKRDWEPMKTQFLGHISTFVQGGKVSPGGDGDGRKPTGQ